MIHDRGNKYHKGNGRESGGGILKDAFLGMLAGAVATLAMGKASGYLYELEDEQTRKYEVDLRGGEYPPEVLAEKVSERVAGAELSAEQRQRYGKLIHWGYGITWGGLYGALHGRVPLVDVADGVGFGTGLWLIGDELMVPTLGLSPPSTRFPWQNHARAFANHFVYGATVGITYRLMRGLSEIRARKRVDVSRAALSTT